MNVQLGQTSANFCLTAVNAQVLVSLHCMGGRGPKLNKGIGWSLNYKELLYLVSLQNLSK